MYHHRGAYLQSLAMAYHAGLGLDSVFLWTLPMFHCNGWCFTWAVTAAGGTHLCLPRMVPATVWDMIERYQVTHFNAAPTVLTMLAADPAADPARVHRPITVATGGAPPSPALLERMAKLDIDVTHLYGLTETFGPVAIRQLPPEASSLPRSGTGGADRPPGGRQHRQPAAAGRRRTSAWTCPPTAPPWARSPSGEAR